MTGDRAAFLATGGAIDRRAVEHAAAYAVARGVSGKAYDAARRGVYFATADLPRATAADLAEGVLRPLARGMDHDDR